MNLGWTSRQRWWMLAAAWLALLGLGIWGFLRQADELGLDVPFLDQLYFTLQLAALSYDGPSESINWQLQVARFAAPVLAAGTLLQSASVVFREQFGRLRARRAQGHTIVCGLDGVGTRLVEALVADGRTVVAVETDSSAPGVATATEIGVPVVYGDPTDVSVLQATGVERAARVVAATPVDGVNVAIASTLRTLPPRARRSPLRCSVRLTDGELAGLLRATELRHGGTSRVEFFNIHERAAHALLSAHPLAPSPDDAPAHLLVFGLGQFGGAVTVAAAQRWADIGTGPLSVTVVDRAAPGRILGLTMQHPALGAAIDAVGIELDVDAPNAPAVDLLVRRLAECPPSLVVIAFEDESQAWSSGLFVRRWLTRPTDVVVRTDSDGGLGQQLQAAVGEGDHVGRVVSFAVFANACSVSLIEGGAGEQLARSIHEDYLASREASGGSSSLVRPWDDLDDAERDSSRAAADAIVERVAALGYELVPLRRWGAVEAVFSDGEVERLAAEEHARWRSERESAGWRWGAVRDDATRTNPLLVEWDELDDVAREQNLRSAAALPELLARAGFEVVRSS